ncbi:MAG: multiheme c-type cytochrome [Planctomycetota bacterium]
MLLVALATHLVVLVTAYALLRPRGRGWLVMAACAIAVVPLYGLDEGVGVRAWPDDPALSAARPADRLAESETGYASSDACRACHPEAYESWARSYHSRMTQAASEAAILAPEAAVSLTHEGRQYRFYRDTATGQPMADMPRPGTTGAAPADRYVRPVVMTTGSHHMQAYWIAAPWDEHPVDDRARADYEARCGHCHDVSPPADPTDAVVNRPGFPGVP